jgi:sec-independent protein translocase protein TatC
MFDELRPHLAELRKRLGLSVLAVFIMFFVAFSFHKELLDWVTMPLNNALAHSAELSKKAANGAVTTQQVAGAFFVAIKISFMGAFIGALPFILWQIWLFVAPGLYSSEKKLAIPFVLGGTFMFAMGVLFAYYVVTPLGFEFLLLFGAENFTPMINIETYIGFFTHIMIGFGISFELPVAAFLLGALGLITDRTLIDFFRYAVVIIFVAAAILTPPDVLSQLLMAIPLIILYGLSILIVRAVNPAPKEENENLPVPVND